MSTIIMKTVYCTGDPIVDEIFTRIDDLEIVNDAHVVPAGRRSGGGIVWPASGTPVGQLASGDYRASGMQSPRVTTISGNIVGFKIVPPLSYVASGGVAGTPGELSSMLFTVVAQGE